MTPPAASDPTVGPSADPTAPADSGETTEVTITMKSDGTYMVYSGDAPDSGGDDDSGDDTSEDDADAMGDAGAAPAGVAAGGAPMGAGMMGGGSQGQPAQSIGEALKIAMDILNSSASSAGAPGSADDQLNAGFASSKLPTPASGPGSKY